MSGQHISIKTKDGQADGWLFKSTTADAPGVIIYMDAFGPRPGLFDMAQRLSEAGYTVLVPDLYNRRAPYEQFDAKTTWTDEKRGPELKAMMAATTQAMTVDDTEGFIRALRDAGVKGKIGTVGYCMGGARAFNAAAAYPNDIFAAASFHGGNLASDAPDSPHRRAADIKAKLYVGMAGVDGSFPPEQTAILAKALREAEVDYVVENYVGSAHGWAVNDHNVYDEAGAERHWRRMLTLFEEALAP